MILIIVATVLISLAIGILIGMVYRKKIAESKLGSAEQEAKRLVDLAKIEAENLKKEEIIKAKEEIMNSRKELDQEIKERRGEVQKQEARMIQKEESLDRRSDNFEKKEQDLERRMQDVEKRKQDVESLYDEQIAKLQEIASLTKEEAKEKLLKEVEKDIVTEKATMIRESEQKAKEEATKNAKELLTYAIQKCAADHSQETTVSIVALPNDDMKGRIIGREGRNIRALETFTGVDLIIDDTPEAVVLSCFDPVKREIARMALEKLIADGRIHPVRIEETVEKARSEIEEKMFKEGEAAAIELGIINLHPEIIKTLGRLYYRTSYGQNVLKHSIEVGHLAGMLAAEIGADVKKAKRAGLLHDIGKALDQTQEGTHIELGVAFAKKFNEHPDIIHAIEAHHDDIVANSTEAVLIKIADAMSAGRPGARRDTLEIYIKRINKLEEIATSYEGIKRSFAIQAGREVRVIIQPEVFDDAGAAKLARDIAKRIELELDYPGQIKVTVVREIRATEIAK